MRVRHPTMTSFADRTNELTPSGRCAGVQPPMEPLSVHHSRAFHEIVWLIQSSTKQQPPPLEGSSSATRSYINPTSRLEDEVDVAVRRGGAAGWVPVFCSAACGFR